MMESRATLASLSLSVERLSREGIGVESIESDTASNRRFNRRREEAVVINYLSLRFAALIRLTFLASFTPPFS